MSATTTTTAVSRFAKGYRMFLRTIAATAIVCTSMLVVMSDASEDREPWEFVQVDR